MDYNNLNGLSLRLYNRMYYSSKGLPQEHVPR